MPRDSLIAFRRGTAAAWTSANPVLAAGEIGYESDTGKAKVGDGTTIWASLAYFSPGGPGVTYGTPALTLGTANTSGATSEALKRDSTIAAFDTTAPTTQAFGDSAAVGTAAFAARRDHKHAMPATPVTTINKTGSTALTGAVTLTGGTNVTLTQSGQDISIAASGGTVYTPLDGWVDASADTWTYASADSPTFTFTITGDFTAILTPGTRLKLTQTTVKYFIVTKVSVSSGTTTVTIYGGTDYTLANAAITANYYSHVKGPAGFPLDPAKWTVTVTNTSDAAQASPVNGTWYNLGTISIDVPIGAWRFMYALMLDVQRSGAGVLSGTCSLSTANNSDSDTTMDQILFLDQNVTRFFIIGSKEKPLNLSSKTTHYLIAKVNATGHTSIDFRGDLSTTTIRAICTYL